MRKNAAMLLDGFGVVFEFDKASIITTVLPPRIPVEPSVTPPKENHPCPSFTDSEKQGLGT